MFNSAAVSRRSGSAAYRLLGLTIQETLFTLTLFEQNTSSSSLPGIDISQHSYPLSHLPARTVSSTGYINNICPVTGIEPAPLAS